MKAKENENKNVLIVQVCGCQSRKRFMNLERHIFHSKKIIMIFSGAGLLEDGEGRGCFR